jgi:hypothetical protein
MNGEEKEVIETSKVVQAKDGLNLAFTPKLKGINMSKYIEELQKAMDGRSLKSKTMKKVFDPEYKMGSNKTVDALKYLQELPSMVGEDMAINFIEIVANHRAVGWKSLANVVDLIFTYCDNPSEVLQEIITAFARRMLNKLDNEGVADNSGGEIITVILFKHTGKYINEGRFRSSRCDAMIEKNKTIKAIKAQIVNNLKIINPDSTKAVLLRDLLVIDTKSIVPFMHLVQVLTDEEKSA